MTPAQRSALEEVVGHLLGPMWLRDWHLHISDDVIGSDESAFASIYPTDGRKLAVIKVCDEFFTASPEDRLHALIHELTHLHHREVSDLIRLGMIKHLSQGTYDLLWESFRQSIEIMTDQIAYALRDSMQHDSDIMALIYRLAPEDSPNDGTDTVRSASDRGGE